jgi:hypothetical protein
MISRKTVFPYLEENLISKSNLKEKWRGGGGWHNPLFPIHQWLIFNIRFITATHIIPHHKPLNRSKQNILLHNHKTEILHISPRHAGHSLCLQLSCRCQCFYIIWHVCQLEPWCSTLTHRDFRSSVILFGPGESSDVPRRDALCWKYASNLTVPYSWNRKLGWGIYYSFRASTFPLQMLGRYVWVQLRDFWQLNKQTNPR